MNVLYSIEVSWQHRTATLTIVEENGRYLPTFVMGEGEFRSAGRNGHPVEELQEALIRGVVLAQKEILQSDLNSGLKVRLLEKLANEATEGISEDLAATFLKDLFDGKYIDVSNPVVEAGLEPSFRNLEKWQGLESEQIRLAINRGFPSAEEFRRLAHIVRNYEEIHDLRGADILSLFSRFSLSEIMDLKSTGEKDQISDYFPLLNSHKYGFPRIGALIAECSDRGNWFPKIQVRTGDSRDGVVTEADVWGLWTPVAYQDREEALLAGIDLVAAWLPRLFFPDDPDPESCYFDTEIQRIMSHLVNEVICEISNNW